MSKSKLVCLNCGAVKESIVVSIVDRQDHCPECRCRQFVPAKEYRESWEKFDRYVGFSCTFKANTEIPTVRLIAKSN
jgi:hypothetical protein